MSPVEQPEWNEFLVAGKNQFRKGEFEASEQSYENALRLARNAVGNDSSHIAVILSELAECFEAQGKDAQAEECYNRVREILESNNRLQSSKVD